MKLWSGGTLGAGLLSVLIASAGCGDDDADTGRTDTSMSRSGASVTPSKPGKRDDQPPVAGSEATEATMPVTIRFEAKVQSAAFRCGKDYPNVGTPGREIQPVDFRFYVHDVRLWNDQGASAEVELAQDKLWQYRDVALLDFEDGAGECNQGDSAVHTELTGRVAAGRYTGIAFKLGIPPDLNHADLSSQPAPLNKSSLFWSWNLGHVFLAATSRTAALSENDAGVDGDAGIDAADDGGVPDLAFNDHFTHLGSAGCEGDPTTGTVVTRCTRPNRAEVRLSGFDPTTQRIAADFAQIKQGSDVAANAGCHSFTADSCTAPFAQLGIDFESGQVGGTQRVFRVE